MKRLPIRLSLVLASAVLAGLLATAAMAAFARERPASPVTGEAEYLGTALDGELAPDFWLADQRGQVQRLSDFRGRAVVLAFLDPLCTDSCPLTALHFRLANERLGERAGEVVFVAVNVNPNASVQMGTAKWGMQDLANWYFLTGPREVLQPVWQAYHVAAEAGAKPDKPGEQLHTPGVFVIDQSGRSRWYISVPAEAMPEGTVWLGPSLSDLLVTRLGEMLSSR